jgi:hypothetical protein
LKTSNPATIISPAIFCGYESWSVTTIEEYIMRMFGNRVLWRIFGPNRNEAVGSLRNMRNEELLNLYSSPNIIRCSNQGGWDGQGIWHAHKNI